MAGEVSISELRERLEHFHHAYKLCVQIDHWPDVIECQQRNRAHIDRIKEEITKREARGEM